MEQIWARARLQGDYRFEHADLATFKGIAGILDSTGHFQGTLRDLTVDGETRDARFPADALWQHARAHHALSRTGGRDQWRHLAGAGGCDAGPLALYRAGSDCARAGSCGGGRAAVWRPRHCAHGQRGPGADRGFSAPGQQHGQCAADRRCDGEDDAAYSAGGGAAA